MGRPLNKKYFGDTEEQSIKVSFHNGTAAVDGYIIRQRGSKRFLCANSADENDTLVCTLTPVAPASLTVGQMTIELALDDTTTVYASKISGRVLTASDGSVYAWNLTDSTTDGAAQMPTIPVEIPPENP